MSSLEGGLDSLGAAWDRQAWLEEHCLKQVESEGDVAWVCHCGANFGDGSALHAQLAREHELSEEHQTYIAALEVKASLCSSCSAKENGFAHPTSPRAYTPSWIAVRPGTRTPCWLTLSKRLQKVVRKKGPVPLSNVAAVFRVVHGKPLDVCEHTLETGFLHGKLEGVRLNRTTETINRSCPGGGGVGKTKGGIAPETRPIQSNGEGGLKASGERNKKGGASTVRVAPTVKLTIAGRKAANQKKKALERLKVSFHQTHEPAAPAGEGSKSSGNKKNKKKKRKKSQAARTTKSPLSPKPKRVKGGQASSGKVKVKKKNKPASPSKPMAKNKQAGVYKPPVAMNTRQQSKRVAGSYAPAPVASRTRKTSKRGTGSDTIARFAIDLIQRPKRRGGSHEPIERSYISTPSGGVSSGKKTRTEGPVVEAPLCQAPAYQPPGSPAPAFQAPASQEPAFRAPSLQKDCRQPSPRYHLIDSVGSCRRALDYMCPSGAPGNSSFKDACQGRVVAIQLDESSSGTADGKLSLIKIAVGWPRPAVVIFDVVALVRTTIGQDLLRDQIFCMLEDQTSTKVVHDVANSTIALRRLFGTVPKIGCLFDMQLAFEILNGVFCSDVTGSASNAVKGRQHLIEDATHRTPSFGNVARVRRSSRPSPLERAAQVVESFAETGHHALTTLVEEHRHQVLHASQLRMNSAMSTMDGSRLVTFRDRGSCWGGGVGRALMSYELKQAQDATRRGIGGCGPEAANTSGKPQQPEPTTLKSSRHTGSTFSRTKQSHRERTAAEDANSPLAVLQLVPAAFLQEHLTQRDAKNLQDLQEIVLDEGRRPKALLHGRGSVFLCSDERTVVTANDIDKVVGRLEFEGKFGDDNRAGFPGQLHRVSVLRGRQKSQIFGVTLRIGRFFKGIAGIIDDILFRVVGSPGTPRRAASILILGEPGSGKTTVIRDICRKVSAQQTVMIVDTSNEIAGDGAIPHREAIGESRRIMVPQRADQHRIMTEALQNHTPQTIVVDEISNKLEARACLDIKARGVRVVASAHRDFQSLLRNPELSTLLGGTASVTVGDGMARANGGQKVQTQRVGAPVFDVIVELTPGKAGTWSIIKNVAGAVDAFLSGGSYEAEHRTRTEHTSHPANKGSTFSEDVTFRLAYGHESERSQFL